MGKTISFSTGRPKRQPLVVISILLNLMLLGGGSMLFGGGRAGGGAAGGAAARGAASSVRLPSRGGGGGGFAACEPAVLDKEKLEEWGCRIFEKACFDQNNMLLHDGRKTPGDDRFSGDELFTVGNYPSYVLPGYEEPLGTPHFTPKCWDVNIRGPTPLDPPDVWQPKEFTNCTVPLVWWLTYFSIFGDLYINTAPTLDAMQRAGALDRNITLAPVSVGLDLPAWYQPLLEPYTRHKVVSLSSLSSREHIATGQPRCFERALLCNLVGLYTSGGNPSPKHGWTEMRPKQAGQNAVAYFRTKHPEAFAPHDALNAQENGKVLRVAFTPRAKLRNIVNLADVLPECNKWIPPADTPFKSTDCIVLPDGTPENYVNTMAQVQTVHVLVNTHGSGNTFSFFLRGSPGALVEIVPWNFHGKGCTWIDQYYNDWYDFDHSVNTGYFRLIADKTRVFKGPYEKAAKGSSVAWGRDQDVALDFPTLAKVLTKVARGELESNHANQKERFFHMTAEDICPGAAEFAAKEGAGAT